MLSCDRCGAGIPEGQKYCPNCGVKAKTTESVHKKQYVKAARPSIRKVVPSETEQPLGFKTQGSSETENKKTKKNNAETSETVAPVQQSQEESSVIESMMDTAVVKEKGSEAEGILTDSGSRDPAGEKSNQLMAEDKEVEVALADIQLPEDDDFLSASEVPDPVVENMGFTDEVNWDIDDATIQEDIPEEIFDGFGSLLDEQGSGVHLVDLLTAESYSESMPDGPESEEREEPADASAREDDDQKAEEHVCPGKTDNELTATNRVEREAEADVLESDGKEDDADGTGRGKTGAAIPMNMNESAPEKKQNPAKKGRYAQTQKKESKITKQAVATESGKPTAESFVPSEHVETRKKAEDEGQGCRKKGEAQEKAVAPVQQVSPGAGQKEENNNAPLSSQKGATKDKEKDIAPVQHPQDDRPRKSEEKAGSKKKKGNVGKEEKQLEKESLVSMLATKIKKLLSYPMPDEKEDAECAKDFNSDGFYDDTQSSVPPEDAKTSMKQFVLFILWAVIAIATILYMINLIVD